MLSDEKPSESAAQAEVIPTTAEVKANVALAICRAAKNGTVVAVAAAAVCYIDHSVISHCFLADRTNGRAYATLLRLSSVCL